MKFTLLALNLSLLLVAASAFAGAGNEGHGGGALICKDREDNQLLDLWEATIPGLFRETALDIQRGNKPVEAQIDAALARLKRSDSDFGELVLDSYKTALAHEEDKKPEDPPLPPITDALTDFVKPGCTLEPVANYYDDTEVLKFDVPLIATLPRTDIAALWVHEAVYKTLRRIHQATNSLSTRRIVGLLFSSLRAKKLKAEIQAILRETEIEGGPSNLEELAPGRIAVKSGFPGDTYFVNLSIIETSENERKCGPVYWGVGSGRHRYMNDAYTGATTRIPLSSLDPSGLHATISCRRIFPQAFLKNWFKVNSCLGGNTAGCDYIVLLRDYRGQILKASSISSDDQISNDDVIAGKDLIFQPE